MNDEKITGLIESVIQTVKMQADTQWDRDARTFTSRRMRYVSTEDAARESARLGAAAADALEAIRRRKKTQSEMS